MIRDTLHASIANAVTKLGYEVPEFSLEHPADLLHGDYASNVALVLGKVAGKSPRDLAQEIVDTLVVPEDVDKVTLAGPGFINFHLSRMFFRDSIRDILNAGPKWGAHNTLKGKRALIEHTQPNPFKPFHIGHLMSNTIGESISRLYEFSGAEVRRVNYQGDVGLHVAKCLWGLRKMGGDPSNVEDLAQAYVEGNRAYEDQEHARAEIVAFNTMVYEEAAEIQEAYKTGRTVSLEHFEELYRLLDTTFDHYFFESDTYKPGRALVKEGFTKGVFVESDGAVVFPGEAHGLHTRVFLNSQGLPTYEAKELGLVQLKTEKWPFDISITTTAVEQAEYFKVVFKALSLLRPEWSDKLQHIPHGMMTLASGKMSSRKGNVITGESLINDMLALAKEKVADRQLTDEEKDDITKAVAIAGIKYSILKQKAGKNITFEPGASLSFEGDSGPYLQYAYTRAASVLERARTERVAPATELAPREATDLERILYRFPEVVLRAREEHEPHFVTTYLIEVASTWNTWYASCKILDDSLETPYKLAIANAVAHTLKNGLHLLGIRAPQKM